MGYAGSGIAVPWRGRFLSRRLCCAKRLASAISASDRPLALAAPRVPGRRVCVLIGGADVLLAEPEVPVKAGAKLQQLVPYALEEHLGAAKIPVEDMIEAGLVVSGEEIAVPYDRFRDRVMFPIADWRGRVIAFGGRALDKEVSAKYLNSSETPLFHKGATLYNIADARKAAHEGAPVIAVEGYIDVIAMVTAGFEATVAPLGTALTAEQLALMWRMADEPVLCFDGDDAGRRAAYRAVDLALPLLKPGKSLKFAALPDGQDPDDLARSGRRDAIEDVLAAARPLAHVLWARESEAGPFDTPERRAALEARISQVTTTIADEAVRRYYKQDFAVRLRQMFAPQNFAGKDNGARGKFAERMFGTRAFGGNFGGKSFGDRPFGERTGRFGAASSRPPGAEDTYVAASPQLAASPVHRGHRAASSTRASCMLKPLTITPSCRSLTPAATWLPGHRLAALAVFASLVGLAHGWLISVALEKLHQDAASGWLLLLLCWSSGMFFATFVFRWAGVSTSPTSPRSCTMRLEAWSAS